MLNLDGNDLQCINKHFFNDCDWRNLNILKLRNNELGYGKQLCGNQTSSGRFDFLQPLRNLTHLYLDGNFMPNDLPPDFLKNQFNLEELYLSDMSLSNITFTIRNMKKLHLLDLSSNKIGCLYTPQLRDINSIINYKPTKWNHFKKLELNFTLNPLRCSCECL